MVDVLEAEDELCFSLGRYSLALTVNKICGDTYG